MRRPSRSATLGLCVVSFLLLAGPVSAQSPFVAGLLETITVRVSVENPARSESVLCQGFVGMVLRETAYIATAKHCVERPNSSPLTAATVDPGLVATVTYPDGSRGRARQFVWDTAQDAVVLAASFERRPFSYAASCPRCWGYRSFGTGQRIPVMSVLSAGGGPPVVSSGYVVTDLQGRYAVILPAAPGTSGAAVLDLSGNLAGIVVAGYLPPAAQAGWLAGIVPGALVIDLVRYAADHQAHLSPSAGRPSRLLAGPRPLKSYAGSTEPGKRGPPLRCRRGR